MLHYCLYGLWPAPLTSFSFGCHLLILYLAPLSFQVYQYFQRGWTAQFGLASWGSVNINARDGGIWRRWMSGGKISEGIQQLRLSSIWHDCLLLIAHGALPMAAGCFWHLRRRRLIRWSMQL